MKRLISISLAVLLLVSCFTLAVSAATLNYTIRIEGIEKCFYDAKVEIESENDINITIADALTNAVKSGDLTIEGIETNYITSINGEKNGKFGGYDGWQYTVNGETPSVGVADYKVQNGDSILFYYGDMGCQIPVLDTEKVNEGTVKVKSFDTVWTDDGNGNWTSSSAWAPVTGAKLFVGDDEYITDENGAVDFTKHYSGVFSIQVEKKGESGVPLVCRFPEDYTIPIEYLDVDSVPVATEPVPNVDETVIDVPVDQTLYVAQTFKINEQITNKKGNTSYISNRKSIAKVSKNGKVTAVKKGTAVITVKNNGVSKSFQVKVKNPKLKKNKITLKKGGKYTIKITGKAGTQTYKSSDKKTAKVSKSGKITAVKKGKAVITVLTNKSIKLKLKVTVK